VILQRRLLYGAVALSAAMMLIDAVAGLGRGLTPTACHWMFSERRNLPEIIIAPVLFAMLLSRTRCAVRWGGIAGTVMLMPAVVAWRLLPEDFIESLPPVGERLVVCYAIGLAVIVPITIALGLGVAAHLWPREGQPLPWALRASHLLAGGIAMYAACYFWTS